MDSVTLAALISAAGVIISGIISIVASMALVNWRIQQLEKKVDEHNGWGQRFAEQGQDIALIQKDIEYIKTAISEMKDKEAK